jgi:DNA primase
MNSTVQKIKERLSIVEVVSSYLKIEKAGKNYKAKCPFHNEKTPSFSISPERGIYYCFGCGAKGDIFSFVQHFEGTNFIGSLKTLAERAGVDLMTFKNNNDQEEIIYEIMEEATRFYEQAYIKQKEVRDYLLNRGLNDLSIKSFRIGYAPASWNYVFDYLLGKGYKKEDIEKAGLIKKRENNNITEKDNNNYYDRFRERIMFPINDSSGRVIAFSGRLYEGKTLTMIRKSTVVGAKYLNSPETPLFNKSNILFGLDKAKNIIRSRDYSIIVEGQMDLILSHQVGFQNTVAVLGTAFTDKEISDQSKINNLGLLRRLANNIIFAYDSDEAGLRAVNRSAMIALSLDMQVKVAVLPKGKDPADIILENENKWKEIIKNSTNIISFYLNKICNNTNDIRQRGKEIKDIIFPFLRMVNSAIERSAYIKEIYSKTNITEEAIINDFIKYEKDQKISITNKDQKEEDKEIENRRNNLEKKFFSIIFYHKKNSINIDLIDEMILLFKEEVGDAEYQKMYHFYESFSDDLSFEAEMWYNNDTKIMIPEMKEILLNLREEILQNEAIILFAKINKKERDKNNGDIDIDLINYQKIVEKIENIRNCRLK